MWINESGLLYEGDCVVGDREATAEEVESWDNRPVEVITSDPVAKLKAFLEANPDVVAILK